MPTITLHGSEGWTPIRASRRMIVFEKATGRLDKKECGGTLQIHLPARYTTVVEEENAAVCFVPASS